MKNKISYSQQGSVLVYIMIIATIGSVILLGLGTFVVSKHKNSQYVANREQAFQVAEAGIYWYRWYLAHTVEGKTAREVDQFWNSDPPPIGVGEGNAYEAEYPNPGVSAIGKYKLEITPPPSGSSIITVKSTGWTYKNPNRKRTIQVRFRKPAWCEFVVLSDSSVRFGAGTEVYGQIHSNGGVQFDGNAHHLVTAWPEQYWVQDQDVRGWHPGVWTNNPPESERFLAGKKFPVPEQNFSAVIANLNLAKDYSGPEDGGLYLGQDKVSGTVRDWYCGGGTCQWREITVNNKNVDGYHITFSPQAGEGNDTISVRMVTSYGTNSYGILQETTPADTYTVPDNGLIFVENHAWVDGQINEEHLSVVAADLAENPGEPEPPGHDKDIYITNDILYTNKDGRDILGLLAQDNVTVGLYSEDNLEIDAALLARYGRVGRDYYSSQSSPYHLRDTITVYGAIVTKQRYGFSWIDTQTGNRVSGYDTRNITFDNNLIYFPPPFFPTGDKYQIDLWEEP